MRVGEQAAEGYDFMSPSLRKPSCNPKSLYDFLTANLQKIQEFRTKPLFALITDYIEDETVNEIFLWRKELRAAGQGDSFDVLIHSPGGQLTPSYLVARMLSRFTNKWEALVPQTAGSGATLICLGSSNIVMSEIAQLGPLDPRLTLFCS
jgi:ClpP class serine protease